MIMKKFIVFLLSVMVLSVIGCNSTKDVATDTNAGYEETVETEESTEAVPTETPKDDTMIAESEEVIKGQIEATEQPVADKEEAEQTSEAESGEQEEETKPIEERKPEQSTEPVEEPITEQPSQPSEEPTVEPEQPREPEPQPQTVAYSPDSVVAMAIAKCQAGGMITTQDNLATALAEGRITQEEYNEYYPYDGLESSYYSVFVETDLNTAGTTSGQPLRSEDAIATYIADMLLLESSPVFNIVYAGVYNKGGTDFYEFRCLR